MKRSHSFICLSIVLFSITKVKRLFYISKDLADNLQNISFTYIYIM